MAAAPGMSPQMLQMLRAGGAPGAATAGGPGPGGASPTGAPPAAAAIGRMLQGQRQTPQGSTQAEIDLLNQCAVKQGAVLQKIMFVNPKAYQSLMKAQGALFSTIQQLKEGAQEDAEHEQMTSSVLQLLRSSPGGGTGVGGPGGQAMGAGMQLR